jgi:hypothetical protein
MHPYVARGRPPPPSGTSAPPLPGWVVRVAGRQDGSAAGAEADRGGDGDRHHLRRGADGGHPGARAWESHVAVGALLHGSGERSSDPLGSAQRPPGSHVCSAVLGGRTIPHLKGGCGRSDRANSAAARGAEPNARPHLCSAAAEPNAATDSSTAMHPASHRPAPSQSDA